ncbi:hypothetical protein [uncultured Jatrophihabitans sp.]|uniref:hypothetical protein n=1 Tax=uncultured Jatrophihabitans sp. TaxID=1610747 RepID=UPI0035CADFBF
MAVLGAGAGAGADSEREDITELKRDVRDQAQRQASLGEAIASLERPSTPTWATQ